jgi:hypothetical protein
MLNNDCFCCCVGVTTVFGLLISAVLFSVAFGDYGNAIGEVQLCTCLVTDSVVQTMEVENGGHKYISYEYRAYFEVTIIEGNITNRAAIDSSVETEWTTDEGQAQSALLKYPIGNTTSCTVGESTIQYHASDTTSETDLIMFGDHVSEMKALFLGTVITASILSGIVVLMWATLLINHYVRCPRRLFNANQYTPYGAL